MTFLKLLTLNILPKLVNVCKNLGKRTDKHFKRNNCGNDIGADVTTSLNIAMLERIVNSVEKFYQSTS